MDSKVRESIKINKKRKKLSLRRREKSKKREMEILLQNRQTRIYNDTVCLCVWTHVKRWQIVTNCQLINKNSAKRPPLLLQTFKGEKTKGNEKRGKSVSSPACVTCRWWSKWWRSEMRGKWKKKQQLIDGQGEITYVNVKLHRLYDCIVFLW